ncbi:hypothetical protein [Staphylococcus aureus]|uniref:hypothetical protein n=1 Tax=Staphylococcus aureus TaxID=1280 RepID=UPI003219BE2A
MDTKAANTVETAAALTAAVEPGVVTSTASEHYDNELGFPANTPLAEMDATQREAYWRFHAKKHEKTAKSRGDYDALKAELQSVKERLLEDARREGEKTGSHRVLKAAIRGEIRANAPHLPATDIDSLVEIIAPEALLDSAGNIDAAKIQNIIESAGSIAALKQQYKEQNLKTKE